MYCIKSVTQKLLRFAPLLVKCKQRMKQINSHSGFPEGEIENFFSSGKEPPKLGEVILVIISFVVLIYTL